MFDTFWKAYPKKKDKAKALRAFSKLKPDEELLNRILRALEEQSKDKNWVKENRQYMPYGATYLNDRRWEEYYEEHGEADTSALKVSSEDKGTGFGDYI